MLQDQSAAKIPTYSLYGESVEFPDILHCEPIADRAGLHDWHIAPHRHLNLHQIFLITSGHVQMNIDGKAYSMPEMMIVSIPPHCVHGFTFEKQTKGMVLSIPAVEIANITGADLALIEIFQSTKIIPATDKFVATLDEINQEQHLASPARASLLRSLATQLTCHLAASAETQIQLVNPLHAKVTAFETLARTHFAKSWKVADFARALGMSPTHLNRLCREVLNQSPKEYVLALIVLEAKRLLAYTKEDVATVGFRVGFEDPSYFSRVFMRETGQSPRAFRTVYELG